MNKEPKKIQHKKSENSGNYCNCKYPVIRGVYPEHCAICEKDIK